MKNCILFFFALQFFSGANLSAQNGVVIHSPPLVYTTSQIRTKNCIAVDGVNNIYLGFKDIGLGKYTPATSSWVMYDTTNSVLPSLNLKSLFFDTAAGNLWVGTTAGLSMFNGSVWTTFTTLNSGLLSDTVEALYVVGNSVYAGTPRGLNVYSGTWQNYSTANSGIVGDTIKSLEWDGIGSLFIGTSLGLSKFDGATTWINYTTVNSDLISNSIKQVKYVSQKATWINTSAGLCKLSNGIVINTACNYGDVSNYYVGCSGIEKRNDNKIYVLDNYGRLIRINENDSAEIVADTITPNFISLLGFNAVMVFDNNGILWTGYRYLNGALPGGFTSFDENLSTGFTPQAGIISSQKFIDINKVGALIDNRGNMFFDLVGTPKYEVPKCSGRIGTFANGLWIGGFDANGNLHTAAQTYRQTGANDFLPGPLDTTNMATDSLLTITPYDNIWKIDRATIDAFKINFLNGNVGSGTYPVPSEILTYPAVGAGNITRNLAPYVDYNNDGNYNPYDGDYPLIKGDQQLYWIFNDSTAHTETNGPAFGFEIHAQAYAYTCDQYILGDSNAVLDYTTFYKYEIINRSQNIYDSVYVGIFSASNLGNYSDDFAGCDSVLNAGFIYNGDNYDDVFNYGYGYNPPMINCQILKGPDPVLNDGIDNDHDGTTDEVGETNMLTGFINYTNDGGTPYGNPMFTHDYYSFLISRWKNGDFLTYGSSGYDQSNPHTHYQYSGTPYDTSTWNEFTAGNSTYSRRSVLSSGPFRIAPGESRTIDFAYVFTWDSTQANGLNTSIARNTADLQRVKYWFDNNNFPTCLNTGIQNISESTPHVNIYPNPANTYLTIDCNATSNSNISIQIFDMLGRIITNKKINTFDRISVAGLSPSVYFIKINVDGKVVTKKFVKN